MYKIYIMNKIKLSKSNSIFSSVKTPDNDNVYLYKVGTTMAGKNGKLYIIKKINNKKKWIISDFYKEYKKSEKKLIKLMKKSIIKFNYKPYEKNKIFFNGIDVSLPESEITYDNTKNISFIAPYEFRRLCCLSGYYKYVINTGDDALIKDKKIIKTSYFFKLNTDAKIWSDFDKECQIYKEQMNEFIKQNKILIDSLNSKHKKYILKNYIL